MLLHEQELIERAIADRLRHLAEKYPSGEWGNPDYALALRITEARIAVLEEMTLPGSP